MDEYHFGVGRGRVSTAIAGRVEKIARKHDATFTSVTLPGDGPRYWFSTRNYGAPHNGATAKAVFDDLDAAGLWPMPLVLTPNERRAEYRRLASAIPDADRRARYLARRSYLATDAELARLVAHYDDDCCDVDRCVAHYDERE